jgi:hypothetical protein
VADKLRITDASTVLGEHRRICRGCGQVKFVREMLVDGMEIDHCPNCRQTKFTKAAERLKALESESRFVEFVKASVAGQGIRKGTVTVGELANALLDECGGLGNFAKEWRKELAKAQVDKPGSKIVLDGFYGVAKLIIAASDERESKGYDDMSEEELQRELNHALLQLYQPETEGETGVA